MEVAILGFGAVAREVIHQLKQLDAYGDRVRVYCVHVRRNSLSYGPDSVIEIVDKYGDGLRVYNDGYQATDYYTTVSSFEDWLIGESKTYRQVVDCMSYNDDSVRLVNRVLTSCAPNTTIFSANKELELSHGETMQEIAKSRSLTLSFNSIDGGTAADVAASIVNGIKADIDKRLGTSFDWKLASRTDAWFEAAKEKSDIAAKAMEARLIERRVEDTSRGGRVFDEDGVGYGKETLDKEDVDTLKRFVIGSEGSYITSSYYDNEHKRLVVSHEMLDWFFAGHRLIEAASNIFIEPYLAVTSAKYIKYDSPDSFIKPHASGSCPRTAVYVVSQDAPWPLKLDDRDHYVDVDDAIFYHSDRLVASRSPMSESGNSKVETLEVHFAPMLDDGSAPICTCFTEDR